MNYQYHARIDDDRIRITDEARFKRDLVRLRGKVVFVSLKVEHPGRSADQNRYLWGIVYRILADYTGHTEEEIHEYCKLRFNSKRISIHLKGSGEVVDEQEVPGSTADLTTVDFSRYVEKIQRWASQNLGIVIPDPNQTEWL